MANINEYYKNYEEMKKEIIEHIEEAISDIYVLESILEELEYKYPHLTEKYDLSDIINSLISNFDDLDDFFYPEEDEA